MTSGYKWVKQLALQAFGREVLLWLGIFLFLFGLGKALDGVIFEWLGRYDNVWFDHMVIFLTERLFYVLIGIIGIIMLWRVYQNKNHKSKLVPAIFALFVTLVSSSVLKAVFRIPRPYEVLTFTPLLDVPSFSFPSSHTAVAFALCIPFFRISKIIGIFWLWLSLLVGFARVYEGVHYPSDIAAGIFLGGFIGAFFSNLQIQAWVIEKWEQREFRRQSFHLVIGFMAVFLHWVGLFRLRFIGGVLLLGLAISLYSQYYRIPIISYYLERFDRPRDQKFPGRGAFYFLLSVFLCFLVFNGKLIDIAYAAILILSVGDSFNHFIAPQISDRAIPWNPRKKVAGVLIGIMAGSVAAQFFVPWSHAILASTLAITLESFPFKIGPYYIDDNLTVPFVAAVTMYVCAFGFTLSPLWG